MLKELIVFGVGYHHAGMSSNDRKLIETMFTNGELPVLCEFIWYSVYVLFCSMYFKLIPTQTFQGIAIFKKQQMKSPPIFITFSDTYYTIFSKLNYLHAFCLFLLQSNNDDIAKNILLKKSYSHTLFCSARFCLCMFKLHLTYNS